MKLSSLIQRKTGEMLNHSQRWWIPCKLKKSIAAFINLTKVANKQLVDEITKFQAV